MMSPGSLWIPKHNVPKLQRGGEKEARRNLFIYYPRGEQTSLTEM